MSEEVVKYQAVDAKTIEQVLLGGDLSQLTDAQRVSYYNAVCQSLQLNPLTRPFAYLLLDDGKGSKKLVLYPTKDCTDQLRSNKGISVTKLEREAINGAYVVTAYGKNAEGREDSATGVVALEREDGEWQTASNGKRYFKGNGNWAAFRGDALANAMMKAETKAKRRLTLSLSGLGMVDESEIETIPNAQTVVVTTEGEIVTPGTPEPKSEEWRALPTGHPVFKLYTEGLALGAKEDEIAQHLADAKQDAKLALANLQKLYVH
jgi:hypothetical protein